MLQEAVLLLTFVQTPQVPRAQAGGIASHCPTPASLSLCHCLHRKEWGNNMPTLLGQPTSKSLLVQHFSLDLSPLEHFIGNIIHMALSHWA